MKLHLRLDHVNSSHIHQTVFFNGANCGTLNLRHGEYQILGAALLLGSEQMKDHLKLEIDPISHNSDGEFTMPKGEDR
jgi:hypothetical protein